MSLHPKSVLSALLTAIMIMPGVLPGNPTTPALTDWTSWQLYREGVTHPALAIRAAEVERARRNIQKHEWARNYAQGIEKRVNAYADKLTTGFLTRMIPSITPLSSIFTPCPACRDQKLPYLSHGTWTWAPSNPDQIQCSQCKVTFPNEKYPEGIILHSRWDSSQMFSYYEGETFPIFGWERGRPSFSGNIRSRKVSFMTDLMRGFAEAYILTGQPRYAEACRRIMLRLAEVYPEYLVHNAYGEVIDMNPRDAILSLNKLPQPELVYPPNKPDHKLHVGFWTAGRVSGTGLEGTFTRQCVEAYDMTCEARSPDGAPVYSREERMTIERDLLLESTYFGTIDTDLNNKSVANRASAGLVGVCVGHPELARYGLQGFRSTVEDWFLPDGATPESPAYGLMAITGIRDLALVFRDYSDPPDYRDAAGQRIDDLNVFQEPAYPRVWQAFYNTLQGDLSFPPFADSYRRTKFPARDAEILAAMLPEQPRYAALLRELEREMGHKIEVSTAIYLRDPDYEAASTTEPLSLPDNCMPDLRIGFMRTGDTGRESLLTLSASHWGVHHHHDSLNIYYWKNGHELLTDLGYLWDHPEKKMTSRTFAHNVVMIDGAEQETRKRGGQVEYFRTSDHVKVMSASSGAYRNAKTYRRTSALIDHGQGRSYVVDCFEVEGGNTQDYVYHGPGQLENKHGLVSSDESLYDLTSVMSGTQEIANADNSTSATANETPIISPPPTPAWRLSFSTGENVRLVSWNMPQSGERIFIGDGWGQRDSKNADRGATIPYVVRRSTGTGLKTFITLFEGVEGGDGFVKSVERISGTNEDSRIQETLKVRTETGLDTIIYYRFPVSAESHLIITKALDNQSSSTLPTGMSVTSENPANNWSFQVP